MSPEAGAETEPSTPVAIPGSNSAILDPDGSPWGDTMSRKSSTSLHIGFQNPDGFPLDIRASKNQVIHEFLEQHKFDCCGFYEVNVCWKLLSQSAQLHERTRGWFEDIHLSIAHHRSPKIMSAAQVGGAMVWTLNQTVPRVRQCGSDPTGLGRWAWTRYKGRGVSLRIFSAYRPVLNRSGAASAWNQQRTALTNRNDDRDPRTAMLEDLAKDISLAIESGDQIVLGMDANEDTTSPHFLTCISVMGLFDAFSTHGQDCPNTYIWGQLPLMLFSSLKPYVDSLMD